MVVVEVRPIAVDAKGRDIGAYREVTKDGIVVARATYTDGVWNVDNLTGHRVGSVVDFTALASLVERKI